MECLAMKSFAKAFDPSSWAAAGVGPKHSIPAVFKMLRILTGLVSFTGVH